MSNWKNWTIPGEVFQQVLNILPDGWQITIKLESGSTFPYIQLTDENGDTPWDGDGPNDRSESLVDCIGRLILKAQQEGGDDDEN